MQPDRRIVHVEGQVDGGLIDADACAWQAEVYAARLEPRPAFDQVER